MLPGIGSWHWQELRVDYDLMGSSTAMITGNGSGKISRVVREGFWSCKTTTFAWLPAMIDSIQMVIRPRLGFDVCQD